jgi:hypothetical protein
VGKSPDDMMSAVTGTLAARTGRSLEEWLVLVQESGIDPLDVDDEVLHLLRAAYEQNP